MQSDILIERVGRRCLLQSGTETGKRWIEVQIPAAKRRELLGWTVAVEHAHRLRHLYEAASSDGLTVLGKHRLPGKV
jgi:hypothetical protein